MGTVQNIENNNLNEISDDNWSDPEDKTFWVFIMYQHWSALKD